MEWHQLNISLPKNLYQELIHLVPSGKRTKFLTQLTEAGLQQIRLQKAMDKSFGAWAKKQHPELKQGAHAYIRALRRGRASRKR